MIRVNSNQASHGRRTGARPLEAAGSPRPWGMPFAAVLIALTTLPLPAEACSVCFGNAQSPLVQGAAAGVIFLGVVVYAVLMGFGGMTLVCFLRARKLRRAAEAGEIDQA
ncbi:MAG: hypothetical protein IT449_02830 [Phycisphaerales bacterium]|nr:hypothetical protein [Phycisphaerales bacterium]